MKVQRLHTRGVRVELENQDVNYTEHLAFGDHTLRIYLRNNAYQDQSYGKVERWNGEEWKDVVYVPGRSLLMRCGLYVAEASKRQAEVFHGDRDKLISLMKEVLG